MKIILASASPRRRALLEAVGIKFKVCVSDVEEIVLSHWTADQAARSLARQKAEAVAAQYPEACVIGADTVVVIDGQILEKPKDAADAQRMLRLLSGREHRVITGVCLARGDRRRVFSQETAVRFYPLSDDEIARYVATGEPMDKAGSYGIQERGATLIERVEGDYFTVVGLPLCRLYQALKEF